MPAGKGYKAGFSSTPAVKQMCDKSRQKGVTTMASNAGNSGRKIQDGKFPTKSNQKSW